MTKEIVKASEEVIGVEVQNMTGDSLGTIREVMLNKKTGLVEFVVLDFGGFLGWGNKLFAMPWQLFTFSPEKNCFLISVEKDKLEQLEGFDQDHWPNMADTVWSLNLYNQLGVAPTLMSVSRDQIQ